MSKNDITGDSIRSGNRKEDAEKIRENWERIFNKGKGEKDAQSSDKSRA